MKKQNQKTESINETDDICPTCREREELTRIALPILQGLLASGHYTSAGNPPRVFRPDGEYNAVQAVTDAVELANELRHEIEMEIEVQAEIEAEEQAAADAKLIGTIANGAGVSQ
jgi:hypothetical protein